MAKHSDFYVPEPGQKRIEITAKELVEKYKKTHWIFPIEAYIHGEVRLAFSGTGNFPDRRWDVSQVGFVFATKNDWRLSKSAKRAAEAKINQWNQYLSGDVWGYVIEDENGKTLESCWGFYGRDYCEKEGQSMLNALKQRTEKCNKIAV